MQKIKEYVLKNGGVTVANGEIVNYESGYQVCYYSSEIKCHDLDTALAVIKDRRLNNYGIWYDSSSKKHPYVIDTFTYHIEDLEKAIAFGKECNQKAIWDWKNRQNIYMEDVK